VIDVRKGNVVSDHPVSVKMLDGFLNAKRLDIAENGSVLRFGSVAMTIEPNKNSAKDSAKDAAKDSTGDPTKAADQ
jgi:lipopolysaccharide export system protein LptC